MKKIILTENTMSSSLIETLLANHHDPFQGFTSCPDTLRAYLAQSSENQTTWRCKSEEIIDEFIARIPTFKNFQEAYSFLADKRHHVAVAFKQRNEEGRTDYYGAFRDVSDHFRKIVHFGDGEQFWKWQKSKIFDLVYKLIDPVKQITAKRHAHGYVYEDEHMGITKESVAISDRPAVYYCVSIKSPFSGDTMNTLSMVELFEYQDERFNTIRIEYTPIQKDRLDKYYQIADQYYQALLKWQQSDGVDVFFDNAAKLSYLLAHLLLVKHGNVGITEWMLRALAFRKGLYLGQFNYAEKISWDFKAVLTPNFNEYIIWFRQNLFQDYILFDTEAPPEKFTFIHAEHQKI